MTAVLHTNQPRGLWNGRSHILRHAMFSKTLRWGGGWGPGTLCLSKHPPPPETDPQAVQGPHFGKHWAEGGVGQLRVIFRT